MQTLLFTLLAFGILISFHELGHYLVARWCGVKILRFSLGIGKVIYSKKLGKDQTEWCISAFPLGGYVKMLDAREQGIEPIAPEDMAREFSTQSVWKRIAIVLAGPVANFLLAIVLLAGLYAYGVPDVGTKIRLPQQQTLAAKQGLRHGDIVLKVNGEDVQTWSDLQGKIMTIASAKQDARLIVQRNFSTKTSPSFVQYDLSFKNISDKELQGNVLAYAGLSMAMSQATVKEITAKGPGDVAGLKVGDQIVSVNGRRLLDGLELLDLIKQSPAKEMRLGIVRAEQSLELKVTPIAEVVDGKSIGRIQIKPGISPEMTTIHANPIAAIVKGVEKTWDMSVMTLTMIGRMITGEASLKNISGPLTIAEFAGETSRAGVASYLLFLAVISVSLGVMNLLPIPVLDGGHLLYYAVELVTGKPVPEHISDKAQRVGIAILLSLTLLAFYNDIARQWHNAASAKNQTQMAK
jgi:regulator of sigma E protease